ncbi:unnamed protein product, partial [Discosporangium mesarthrocarpum]
VRAVSRARVPVVKMVSSLRGPDSMPLKCDISINNLVAVHNTRLLRLYTLLDVRVRQLLYLVKAWSKARAVNDSSK